MTKFQVGDEVQYTNARFRGKFPRIIDRFEKTDDGNVKVFYKGGGFDWEDGLELAADPKRDIEEAEMKAINPDMVNHPPHYTQYVGFEVIDIVEQLDYLRGTAVKYIMRAGDKWDEAEDLSKAIWYLKRKIKKLKKAKQ